MSFLSLCFKHKEGGYNKKLYEMYEALSRDGDKIFIITAENLPVRNEKVEQKILKIPFTTQENLFFWFIFCVKAFVSSYSLSVKHRPKGILNFGPLYSVLSIVPIICMRIPSIVFIRGDNMRHSPNLFRNLFFFFIDGFGLFLAKKIVFNNETLKARYCHRYRLPPSKCEVVPNHIKQHVRVTPEKRSEVRASLGVKDNEFLLSTSGIFNPGKNFGFLIKAMAEFKDRPVKLLIIGDEMVPTGMKKKLKSMAKIYGVEDRIIFYGWEKTPANLIAISDAFVFPSKHEGMPNSLLEALSCSIPCLGSRICEIEEVLKYDELLFSIFDEKEYIRQIVTLMGDKKKYLKAKSLSGKRCQRFSFNWNEEIKRAVKGGL